MASRAALMYRVLMVLVLFAKKRFLGGATAFDFILVVLIGSVAGRAMTGGAPYFASLFGLVIMIAMHWYFPPRRSGRSVQPLHQGLRHNDHQRRSTKRRWRRPTCRGMTSTRPPRQRRQGPGSSRRSPA